MYKSHGGETIKVKDIFVLVETTVYFADRPVVEMRCHFMLEKMQIKAHISFLDALKIVVCDS